MKSIPTSLYPEQELKRRALAWALKLAVNPKEVRFEYLSAKWGACQPDGTIILAYDVLQQSATFQDYVLVHELLHLKVPNHGRMFKALLTVHIPNWRELEESVRAGGKVAEVADREYC
jgi:predicted metal-dependent hydrolase